VAEHCPDCGGEKWRPTGEEIAEARASEQAVTADEQALAALVAEWDRQLAFARQMGRLAIEVAERAFLAAVAALAGPVGVAVVNAVVAHVASTARREIERLG